MQIAGSLGIELLANIARLQSDMDAAKKTVGGAMSEIQRVAGGAMKALALLGSALTASAFASMVKGTIDAAAGLHDMSIQTGASVAALMALKSVAATSDTTIDGIATAMNKLAKNMAVASEESKGTGQAIQAIGLDFRALRAMAPDQQMISVAKALDKFQDGAGKSAVAMTLFGKEGAKMLPFLKDLADEADAVQAKLTEQQVAAKAAQAAMADDFGDNLIKIKKAGEEWKKDLSLGMLPALYEASEAFIKVTGGAGGFKETIKKLAADGSIAEWSRMAITGITYVMDAFAGLKRFVQSVGETLGAYVAVWADKFGTLGSVIAKVFNGDYVSAVVLMGEATKRETAIMSGLGAKLDEIWGAKTFGQNLRDRMAELKGVGAAAKENKAALDFDAAGMAAAAEAAKKEAEAYAGLTSGIRAKTAENKIALLLEQNATESQKSAAKMDAELASGKLKLSDAHIAAARGAMVEQAATEELLRVQKGERDVLNAIIESTNARLESRDMLASEYALYGQSNDARALAAIAIKAEADLLKYEAAQRKAGLPLTEEQLAQLRREKDLRVQVEQATMAQTKALGYAQQLMEENKKFGLDYILDERARAAATLAIDTETWQERIRLAGEGTEAQKKLQEQYATWYQNQTLKPELDAQKKLWTSIESTAHDTFISIFNSGKSAFDRLRDTLKNGLLELLYQMTIKKWIFDISASVNGSGGMSGMSQAADSLGGGGGAGAGSFNIVMAAKSAYDAVSKGFAGIGDSVANGVQQGINMVQGQSYSPFVSTNGGFAQGVGTASQYMAGAYAGKTLGSAISGQYSVGDHGSAVVNIATITGAIFGGPIGAAIGGAIGGLINRAFGMGEKSVVSRSLTGNFGSAGFSGTTNSTWHQPGGWFRGDQDGTDRTAVDAATAAQFAKGYDAIKAASADFARALGVNADSITDRAQSMNVALTTDAAANQKAVEAFFTGVANDIALELIPSLSSFAKEGEAASTTLQRVAGDYAFLDAALNALGVTFGAVGVGSIAARERLIDLAGGLDEFGKKSAYFAQNFESEAERMAPVIKALNEQMAALGLSGVTTIAQFKDTVLGIATSGRLATEEGAKLYATLLAIAPQFKAVDDYAKKLGDTLGVVSELATKAGAVDAARATVGTALQRVGDALHALGDKARATMESLASVRASISAGLFAAQDAAAAAMAKVVDVTRQAVDSLGKFSTNIRDFITGLRGGNSFDSKTALEAQLKTTAALAQGGDAKAQEQLTTIAQKFLEAAAATSGDALSYARQESSVKTLLSGVADAVDARRAALLAQTPAAGVAGPDAITQAQAELQAAQLKLLGFAAAAAAASASTDRSLQVVAGSAADLVQQFNLAREANAKAQLDYAAALNLTSGLSIHSTGTINAFLDSLVSLNASQADLKMAQDALSKAILDEAARSAISQLDYAKSLGLTGDAAAAFAATMLAAGLDTVGYTALMRATHLSAQDLQTALSASGVSASDAALRLAGMGSAGSALAGALVGARTSTAELAALLAASHITLDDFKTAMSATGLSADALAAVLGGPNGLGNIAILSGVSLGAFGDAAHALGLSFSGFKSMLDAAGLSAADFQRLKDVTGAPTADLSLYLQAAAMSGRLIAGAMDAARGNLGTLANALGDASGLNPTALSLAASLVAADVQAAGLPGSVAGVSSAMDQLKASLGFTGAAADAMAQLMRGFSLQTGGGLTPSPAQAVVMSDYATILGRPAESGGLAYWTEKLASGMSTDDLAKNIAIAATQLHGTDAATVADQTHGRAWLRGQGVPGFASGTGYVPHDMTARIHEGEEITPRPYVDAQRASRDMTNAILERLVDKYDLMAAEIALLRVAADKTETNTRDTAMAVEGVEDLTEQVIKGGLSFQTRAQGTDL